MNIEDCNGELEVKEKLQKERKDIKTFDDLMNFLERVKTDYNTGYGIAPRAIAQAALATAFYLSSEFEITGFQAGFIMWEFIRDWNFSNNKVGMKLVDYDDMLYPQYGYKFEKTISKHTFELLQKEALNLYNDESNESITYSQNVVKHWKSIINGEVPFGYTVKD